MTYILKDFSMAKGKRGDNNNNNDNMTNTGLRDDDSSSKNGNMSTYLKFRYTKCMIM